MPKNRIRIAALVLLAGALAACGKGEERAAEAPPSAAVPAKAEAASPSVAATNGKAPEVADPKGSLRQLASQKSVADAARCSVVFSTAAELASQGGDSNGAANMRFATRATQIVMDVASADRAETAQSLKNTQTALRREAQSWSQQQFEAYVGDCTKTFSDMGALMVQAGVTN